MRLKKSARPKLPTVAAVAVAVAVAVVVAVSTAPVHSSEAMFENAVTKASWNVEVTNAELHKLERHVRRDPDGKQVFNKGAAEASGAASASTLSLADEIVRFQNEAHARMLEARVANLLHVKIDLNNYPLLRPFFEAMPVVRATQSLLAHRITLEGVAIKVLMVLVTVHASGIRECTNQRFIRTTT